MVKRLLPFIALFFTLTGILFLLNFLGLQTLAAVRAYVGAESRYSKGQKEATYNLSLYISTQNEIFFQKFKENIALPLGAQEARLELEKDQSNMYLVRSGFIKTGIHPADIRNMVLLFKYGRNSQLMKKPVAIWIEADVYINKLHTLGYHIHEEIKTRQLSLGDIHEFQEKNRLLDDRLTLLEQQFSVEISNSIRELKSKILVITFIAGLLLFGICVWLTAIFIAKLKESGEKYRRLFRESLDMVFISSVNGEILSINQAGLNLLGVSSREEINQFRNIIPFYKDSSDRLIIREEIARKGFVKDFKVSLVSKDGRQLQLLVSATSIKNRKNDIVGYRGIVRDVTDKLYAEEQLIRKNVELEKTNAELDRLVYTTSHDLRSPLNSVLGLIELAKMETSEKERAHYFSLMEKAIKGLDGFVLDIMNYSRNSRLEILIEEVWFDRLIDDSIESFKFIKNVNRIKFTKVINQTEAFNSDKNRIITILNNLIYNAIKFHEYSRREPFIYIEVTVKNNMATIRVKDNGRGIEEKHQTKVFGMFYKGHQADSGSGLGLYIVKEMVTKLKGKISLYSILGTGTEFVIQLPELKDYSSES
ncbi:hypothetical protein C3K47_01390 [Solitalea longa]|uniref:histidine kinase n=1 Tax=Solitalea longa TaxID=2079460 RepID=A0A2S5AAB4_9SPHI|nr:PAS domain-containing sensor histidine kinase [Solitalea longa]POY39177.1 hypothetical protein C3K47_01390 [Solitalea longa]